MMVQVRILEETVVEVIKWMVLGVQVEEMMRAEVVLMG